MRNSELPLHWYNDTATAQSNTRDVVNVNDDAPAVVVSGLGLGVVSGSGLGVVSGSGLGVVSGSGLGVVSGSGLGVDSAFSAVSDSSIFDINLAELDMTRYATNIVIICAFIFMSLWFCQTFFNDCTKTVMCHNIIRICRDFYYLCTYYNFSI